VQQWSYVRILFKICTLIIFNFVAGNDAIVFFKMIIYQNPRGSLVVDVKDAQTFVATPFEKTSFGHKGIMTNPTVPQIRNMKQFLKQVQRLSVTEFINNPNSQSKKAQFMVTNDIYCSQIIARRILERKNEKCSDAFSKDLVSSPLSTAINLDETAKKHGWSKRLQQFSFITNFAITRSSGSKKQNT